jgi:MFS family permease
VLAKHPLHLTPEQIRWRAVAPILLVVVGAYTASAISDRVSRKTVMQIGVVVSTFFTLLIPLAQAGTQLIIIRVLRVLALNVTCGNATIPWTTVNRSLVTQVRHCPAAQHAA